MWIDTTLVGGSQDNTVSVFKYFQSWGKTYDPKVNTWFRAWAKRHFGPSGLPVTKKYTMISSSLLSTDRAIDWFRCYRIRDFTNNLISAEIWFDLIWFDDGQATTIEGPGKICESSFQQLSINNDLKMQNRHFAEFTVKFKKIWSYEKSLCRSSELGLGGWERFSL